MTPSTHLELPPETTEKKQRYEETLVLEPREATPLAKPVEAQLPHMPEEGSFQSSMLEFNRMRSGSRFMGALVSLAINASILVVPIFLGLYFTDTLDMRQFASTFLVAPPPPPPPPPAPAAAVIKSVPPKKVFENAGKLIAPTVVPQSVAMIKEAPLPPDIDGANGVAGGVPGGVAGGSLGGVIGGVIGGASSSIPAPLAPKSSGPKAPVRVGGRVKEPRLITRVEPLYPPLARQTHMQGVVVLEAIIDERGEVGEMRVVSGPPLLIQSALTAVKQWKYEPTYLNDEPVRVQLNVTVTFTLMN